MKKRLGLRIIAILLITFILTGCNTGPNSEREIPIDVTDNVENNASEAIVTEDVVLENILTAPSNEQIMGALIEYSNTLIDLSNDTYEPNEEVSSIYYFEEGRYVSKIYSGNMVDEMIYRCIVETTRAFNLVDVTETLLITLTYEENSEKWYVCDYATLQLTGDWKITRYWNLPESSATISFSEPEYIYVNNSMVSELYPFNYSYGDISWDGYLQLTLPTFTHIYSSSMTGPDGSGISISRYIRLDISPDSAWYTEYELGNHAKIDEETLGVTPTVLSTTGIIDMSTDEVLLPYMNAATDIANILFLEHDISKLTDKYLFKDGGIVEELNDLSEQLTSNDFEVLSVTPYMAMVEDEYDGIIPIVCYVCIELSSNDIHEYGYVGICLYEHDGKICLLGVDM